MIARCAGSVTVFDPVTPPFDDTHPAVNPVNALPLLPLAVYATRNCPGFGRVTPVRVDLVNDTTTVEVHYAPTPAPAMPSAERHDAAVLTR